jgi:hypothetical protein
MDVASRQAYFQDREALRKEQYDYIGKLPGGAINIDSNTKVQSLGYNHTTTALAMIPIRLRQEFIQDPASYVLFRVYVSCSSAKTFSSMSDAIIQRRRAIPVDAYASVFYPNPDAWDPTQPIDAGLFMGEHCIRVRGSAFVRDVRADALDAGL